MLPRSDGADVGEDRREPMPSVTVQAEFAVAATRFWTKTCPVLITRAERSRFRPRIGRSRALRRPWGA